MAIKASLGGGALTVLCRTTARWSGCRQAQRFSTVLSDLASNEVDENGSAATYWYGWGLFTAVLVVVTWTYEVILRVNSFH